MNAAFSDPQGPLASRIAPYALPLLFLLFADLGPLPTGPSLIVALVAVGLFNAVGIVSPHRQRRSLPAQIELGPGYVDVTNAGTRCQRISAKSILGATTARTASGVTLTLHHAHRDQPITIEVASDAEADALRRALGIGHNGFGVLAWRTRQDVASRVAMSGRVVGFLSSLVVVALAIAVAPEAAGIAAMFLGPFGFLGSLLGIIGLFSQRDEPSVVMTPESLHVRSVRGWLGIAYESIVHADDHERGVVFGTSSPYGIVGVEVVGPAAGGLGINDRKNLLAQVTAAGQRARGLGPRKHDVVSRLDILRRTGETARDWLARLDVAGQTLSQGGGYRGQTLDANDLWSVLEDPDADGDLRAAAARMLRHTDRDGARVRIDAAVAAVRDESVNKRLRIAMSDDLDDASQELATLDAAAEVERPRGVLRAEGR